MKFENTKVYNFEGALHGMRNAKESWSKSDSFWEEDTCIRFGDKECTKHYVIGENDMRLAQSLIRAGSEHRKFLRQIFVSVDITAPLFWWKEFDTYKVGTVANSTSTMHKIASKPITLECFETDDFEPELSTELKDGDKTFHFLTQCEVNCQIDFLESLRRKHLEYDEKSKNKEKYTESERMHFKRAAKKCWKELIRWLPESWLQTRTVTMTYENLFAMCSKGQRRFHKLNEWSGVDNQELTNFISWARKLPYAKEFIFIDEEKTINGSN